MAAALVTSRRQGWGRGQQPVINVTWDDAQQYVAWLSQNDRQALSAAHRGRIRICGARRNHDGLSLGRRHRQRTMANCDGCGSQWDSKQTAPVGSFAPNQFGLYDMVGNVWEWTEDCCHDNYDGAPADGSAWIEGGDCKSRIVRGGSWVSSPGYLRSAIRSRSTTDIRGNDLGFRVGRTLSTGGGAITIAPGVR